VVGHPVDDLDRDLVAGSAGAVVGVLLPHAPTSMMTATARAAVVRRLRVINTSSCEPHECG
jgi:hypothetical protein